MSIKHSIRSNAVLEKNVDSFVDQYLIPVEKYGNLLIFCQILKRYFFWWGQNYAKLQKNYHTIFG
jgi:hypothetical protein